MTKYKKIIALLIICQQLFLYVKAQKTGINERIPDVLLTELFRYAKNNINLRSEFKGKPLIIDFWFTYCGSCIAAMPKLDSLHEKYKGKFNVLMSTFEKKETVSRFLTNKYTLRNVSLPTTTSDTILLNVFPHLYYPHEIWIDKNGIVQAITGADEITEENITKFINGEPLHLAVKQESNDISMNTSKLFLEVDPTPTFQYSYIGGYQKKMGYENSEPQENGLRGVKVVNYPLKRIYTIAYSLDGIKNSQYIYEKIDSTLFESYDYSGKNLFCYDLMLKDTSRAHVFEYMQKDLDRYFKITTTVKNKPALVYVLSKVNKPSVTDTTDIAGGFADSYIKDGNYVLSHSNWRFIKYYLNNEITDPIIDETGYTLSKKFRFISIPMDWSNLEKVNREIEVYNLKITREIRKIDFLVFSYGNENSNDITKH
ncbi:TlpA family protein disulfide reductase [Chitinophaga sp. RAB17]|uniref:TlpA family protein disulfide reductase n=1 Tax=Chitinophaga sp. RAB17 TaxID=3233049 RepID=UPI003F8ED5E6